MAYKVKIGDKEMSVGKLPIDVLQTISEEQSISWAVLMEINPAVNINIFRAVVDACAEQLGVETPTADIKDGYDLLVAAGFDEEQTDKAWVEEIVNIADKPMGDGFPTTPDAPESSSSSGQSGDSDGLPTSPEDNQQTTS